MIQRIQSVYLGISFILGILLLSTPFFKVNINDVNYRLTIWGLNSSESQTQIALSTLSLEIIVITSIIISFISVFLYKNRKLQLKVCKINIFLTISFIGLLFLTLSKIPQQGKLDSSINYGLILPFLIIILHILAIRGIRKDIELIKSVDRIR